MNEASFSFVHTFGPFVQLFYALFLLVLVAVLLVGISFWVECKLLRTNRRWLSIPPIAASAICILYGVLRFSWSLLYPTDRWYPVGIWDYTNQNQGMYIIFLFGCLLTGMIAAVLKETRKSDAA